VILADCHERVYSENTPMQTEEMGLYFIRGDNIAVIGEIDEALEANMDYSNVKATPLKSM
jgi:U6 snRNA-associated Sm-like protein LSm8